MNCLLCLVVGLGFQLVATSNVNSPTPLPGNLIAFQLKTICTCQFKTLSDSTFVACDQIYYLNILNAYLFDSPSAVADNASTCEAKTSQTPILGTVTDAIDTFCYDFGTNNNCSITESFLINLFQASGSSVNKVRCLSVDIFYSCVLAPTTSADSSSSSSTPSYNMTYFFYIITLILSSSCILIGVGLVLRRVLLHRNARAAGAGGDTGYPGAPWALRHRRHFYPTSTATSGTSNQGFVGPPPPADGLWTMPYPPSNHSMMYPPPSYDRINESVVPPATNVVPPPYDTAAVIWSQKKEEEVIMSMAELTTRVDSNNNNTTSANQSDESITSTTTTTATNNTATTTAVPPSQDNNTTTVEASSDNNNNNNTGNQIV